MDFGSVADGLLEVLGRVSAETWRNLFIFVLVFSFVLYALRTNGFLGRVWRTIEGVFFSNWQLALLGLAAVVLSFASGWRTWDGMRNFTSDPLLSLMITFGIQAVML